MGYYNYKAFFLLIFYLSISTNIATWNLWLTIIHGLPSLGAKIFVGQGAFLSTVLSCLLSPFWGFHCWLVSKNVTTLEYCEKLSSSRYDVGLRRNAESIFGTRWSMWLIPVFDAPGNGVDWETPEDWELHLPAKRSNDCLSQAIANPLPGALAALDELMQDVLLAVCVWRRPRPAS